MVFVCQPPPALHQQAADAQEVEVVGYGARFKSGQESPDWTLGPYIAQALLLLVAPALFAATIYMELGRVVLLVDGESRCFMPRKWMTKIFVAGDVLSFFLQGGGKPVFQRGFRDWANGQL